MEFLSRSRWLYPNHTTSSTSSSQLRSEQFVLQKPLEVEGCEGVDGRRMFGARPTGRRGGEREGEEEEK